MVGLTWGDRSNGGEDPTWTSRFSWREREVG